MSYHTACMHGVAPANFPVARAAQRSAAQRSTAIAASVYHAAGRSLMDSLVIAGHH